MPEARARWLAYAPWVLAVVALLQYGPTVQNEYCLDDYIVVGANDTVVAQGVSGWPRLFTSHYSRGYDGEPVEYRPLTKASFALEWDLWGDAPPISHAINVLMYVAIVLLFFRLLQGVLPSAIQQAYPWLVFLAALVYAVHPLHTEVVASLKNREELFASLFGLLCWHASLRWARRGQQLWLGMALLALLAGLFSKLAVLPFVGMVPLSLWVFGHLPPRRAVGLFGLLAGVFVGFLVFEHLLLTTISRRILFVENPLPFLSQTGQLVGTWGNILFENLRLLVWPWPLQLYYGLHDVPISTLARPQALLGWVGFMGLGVWGLFNLRRRPLVAFAVLATLGGILPYVTPWLPYTGMVGDRALFVATMGFALLVAAGWAIWASKPGLRFPALAFGMVVVMGMGIWSGIRGRQWHNLETLLERDLPHMKRSVFGNNIAGITFAHWARGAATPDSAAYWAERSAKHFERVLELEPNLPKSWYQLGEMYETILNSPEAALRAYGNALRETRKPTASNYLRLGRTWLTLNRPDSAQKYLQTALRLEPTQTEAMNLQVKALAMLGRMQEAWQLNLKLRQAEPKLDHSYVNAGNLLVIRQQPDSALPHYWKALEIQPNNPALKAWMLQHLRAKGDSASVRRLQSLITR